MKKTLQTIVAILALTVVSIGVLAAEAKAKKSYPLKTCVVSGDKLGEMGDPFVFTVDGQEVKLCCKSCKKDFDKDKTKFMKKIQESAKPAKP